MLLIAIRRRIGDKWQSKILFLAIFDPRLSIVKSVFDFRHCIKFEHVTVLPGLTWPPFFAFYSIMVISIEKEITEMNLYIDSVIILFFSLKYDFFNIGWN